MPANRWQAFLIHLGISAVLYVGLLYLIFFHWYPQPYFAVDGGWEGVQIITGVDLVLGPVLTLMVYNRRKRELKRDLAIIGMLQLVALVWGTWLVYDQRTAAVVFASGRFNTLSVDQIVDAGDRAQQLVSESRTRPPYFLVRMPTERKEWLDMIARAMKTGIPLTLRGDLYEPVTDENRMQVLHSAIDIERRVKNVKDDRAKLDEFLSLYGGTSSDYGFVPLSARYGFLLLALSRKDASIVGALDIRPSLRIQPPPRTPDNAVPAKPENRNGS